MAAQETKQVGGNGSTTGKTRENWWRQSKAAKEKGEDRYYIEFERAGVIKNVDGTFTELTEVLDPKAGKNLYSRDGITYYIWTTKDDDTGADKHLVQRVPDAAYKENQGKGGGGGKGYPQKRVIDSKIILQGIALESLKDANVDGTEVDCKLVSEYLSGKKGWDWVSPGTTASDALKHVFVDEMHGQLVLVYQVVKREKSAGSAESTEKKDEKKN